jgi:DNA-binding beta-propeller fold protein YncE
MPNHNIESDADLTKSEASQPDETVSGASDMPEGSTTEHHPSPADPEGGESAAGRSDASETEQIGSTEGEATAVGTAETESEDEAQLEEGASPAEGDGDGLAVAAPIAAAASEATGEPASDVVDQAGEDGTQASTAEGEEEGLAGAAAAVGTAAGLEAEEAAALALQAKKRRRLIVGLVVLAVLVIAAVTLFVRYLLQPGPLPDLLPLPVGVNYPPHYLFSIYGVDKPVGVAVSPDGERIYATESSGGREIKAFDRDGSLLYEFSPPDTGPAERAPVYVAVGPTGRVFVTDRLQRAVFVYDADGKLLDAVLSPDLTLSEFVSKHVDGLQAGGALAYNFFGRVVRFQTNEGAQVLTAPDPAAWAPLGVRVDESGTMFLTDVPEGQHAVREFPGALMLAASWREFDPPEIVFGTQGQKSGEFMYPNSAVADSAGRLYVTDGNNGRVSVWDGLGNFLFDFAQGVGESALSLPRGAAMDKRDRLHVVDAVQQSVKVYDVSEDEPRFLFAFGDWGMEDGEFNYPVDIALDGTGRLYIADRENNRIQVWSY